MADRERAHVSVSSDKLFEFVVGVVLGRNGFLASLPKQRLKGRAASHQIDSIGLYCLQVPFVFPIRLVAEAKCYARQTVGIDVVRNLCSVVDDLNQTLPGRIQPPVNPEDTQSSSHYVGAIFSTSGFSSPAYQFGCARGVFCVDLEPTVQGDRRVRSMPEWMDELALKLRVLARERSCPNDRIDSSESYDIVEKLVKEGVGALDGAQRDEVLRIIEAILTECPIFAELSLHLSTLHLGAFGGNAVVVSVSTRGWPLLIAGASHLAQMNAELALSTSEGPYLHASEFRPRIAVEDVEDVAAAQGDESAAAVPLRRLVLSIAPFGDDEVVTAKFVLSAFSLDALRRRGDVRFVIPVTETLVLSGECSL